VFVVNNSTAVYKYHVWIETQKANLALLFHCAAFLTPHKRFFEIDARVRCSFHKYALKEGEHW